MIVDCLANGEKYELGDTWPLIVEFLKGLDEVSEERKYVVQEDAIFGRVATIHTGTAEESVLEAHRTYVDIHVVLNGVERLDWFPLEGLDVKEDYDEDRDAEFFVHNVEPMAQIYMRPGNFVLLYPQDAHMPKLMVDESAQPVKKIVLKVRADLLA